MSYKPKKKAVALEYGKNPAPLVTAKGEDKLAEAIIAEARKQGVHIAEDPQLVGLLSQLQIITVVLTKTKLNRIKLLSYL